VPLLAPALLVGLTLAAQRRDRDLASGLTTTAAAALMTAVAYDAGPGEDWSRAWLLTAVMAAYYVGTVLYVKTMIRERGHRPYVVASVTFHGLCASALLWWSLPLSAVFVLLTARAAYAPRTGMNPKQVGIGEIVLNTVVVVVALLAT
jgi:hypothetical protein